MQCMTEGADGLMWFGTMEGIWSYDGLNWANHPDGAGMCLSLAPGPGHSLFAAGRQEIKQYEKGTWNRIFSVSRAAELRKIAVLDDGSLWVASSWGLFCRRESGWTLFTVPEIAEQLRKNQSTPPVNLVMLPESILAKMRTARNLPKRRYEFADIYADHEGRIWLGTTGGEILCFKPDRNAGSGEWQIYNEMDGIACGRSPSILELQNGLVWVVYGSSSGYLNEFNGETWKKASLVEAGLSGECANMIQTRDGVVWVSGRNWVGALRDGRWHTYQRPEIPIPSEQNFLCEAADGALWMGGPNTEIQRIDYETPRWQTLQDLNFQWESPSGAEWFLHRDGRVIVHESDGAWTSYGVEDGLMDAPVLLLGTRSGTVWAAGSQGHIASTARFDGRRWTRFDHRDFSWGVDWRAALAASDGSVWFGAAVDSSGPTNQLYGLLQFRDDRWIAYHQPGRFPSGVTETNPAVILPATQRPEPIGKFLCLGESRDGSIWAGRSHLVVSDGHSWSVMANDNVRYNFLAGPSGIHFGTIESMFTSKKGDLWIGTRQYGAVRYDGHAWKQFQGDTSLVANSVRSLTETGDGSIWAGTDRGVSRFDGRNWTADVLPEALGTPEEEGNLVGTSSGKLWVNRFYRNWHIRAWPKVPPPDGSSNEFWTVCHQFKGPPPGTFIASGGDEVSQPGNISILWGGIQAWHGAHSPPLQFSYRLDQAPWSAYSFDGGHAFFTLPPGPHHFEVRARDRNFNVDPTPAVLDFVVLPPVSQQAWFRVLIIVVGGLLAGLSIRVLLERARWHRAHEHLSSIISSVDGIVWEADAATFQFTYVSEQAERLLGYPTDQWLKDPSFWASHIHPEDRQRTVNECVLQTRELRDHQLEYRYLTADGRTIWLRDIVTVLTRNNKATRLRGIMVDVTVERLAEQRIRQLNRTYAVLSDINQLIVRERDPQTILDGVCRVATKTGGFRLAWVGMLRPATEPRLTIVAHAGADDGMLQEINRECEQCEHRCPPISEVLRNGGHALCELDPNDPSHAHCCPKDLQSDIHAMASFALTANNRRLGVLNLYASEPQFFDKDELALLKELAADISYALENCEREEQRVRAEDQLRVSEIRFRELAETIDEVFWITDATFARVFYVSPAYEKIWGRSCQSLYETPRSRLSAVHTGDREGVLQAIEECGDSGKYQAEYRVIRPNGEVRWIFDHGIPVRNAAGQVERIVGVARDVTENRQLGEQLRQSQKLEAIGQLAGGVAHDFNNILSAILMQTDLMSLSGKLAAEEMEGLREIRADTERAANLTRQLLLFSRKQMMQARNLDLNEVVTGLAKMLQRIIGEDVRLQLNLHPTPLPIHADAGMLDQVLMNLAVNARDAMPDGGKLTIETSETIVDETMAQSNPEVAPGHFACIRVADTGSGIPPEVLPRIFEPFFTTKEPGKGTGLGLATVFGIVKQHRGWIQLESKVGVGTTFSVFLPASAVLGATGEAAPKARARGGSETILVAEDDPSVRRIIRTMLSRHGYKVICADNGEQAIKIWDENPSGISLLLTDMVMPGGVNGKQLADKLRQSRPCLKVIFISGYSGRVGGKEIHVDDSEYFIQKPFHAEDLLGTVRRALDNGGE